MTRPRNTGYANWHWLRGNQTTSGKFRRALVRTAQCLSCVAATKQTMPDVCLQCGDVLREYIRVPHYNEHKDIVSLSLFCTDCWASWQNSRENLDGTNEMGVQGMTCPDCQRVLSAADHVYMRAAPVLYPVQIQFAPEQPPRTFLVTTDTQVQKFKHMIALVLSSTDFDLVMDDVVVDRVYLGAHADSLIQVVPPRRWELHLSLGHDAQWVLTVSPTLLLSELRQTIALYTDIPATDQSIQHGAHTLQSDDGSLQSYGLHDGVELVVTRVRWMGLEMT